MAIADKIKKVLQNRNPKKVVEEIERSYEEKKENGEQNPIDSTVKQLMQIIKENPDSDTIRIILKEILEQEKIPNRIFEKTATQISKTDEIPDNIIAQAVTESKADVPDKVINTIIEEGEIDVNERLKLINNVDDERILQNRVNNELEILYRVCKNKRDNEVVERIEKLESLLGNVQDSKETKELIQKVIARKMAENCYSDISKGTRIYTLSKAMPIEKMIEVDLPNMVIKEYSKIEKENNEKKEGRATETGIRQQILGEMAENIGEQYKTTGVFVIPQSESMKKLTLEEEQNFIKLIKIYSGEKIDERDILDIKEQIKGKVNDIQLKENILINDIKKVPENKRKEIIVFFSNILNDDDQTLKTLQLLQNSQLINRLNSIPEDKREDTIKTIDETLSKKYKTEKETTEIKDNTNTKKDMEDERDR